MTAAGMQPFGDASEVTGSRPRPELTTGGVYRVSRNPQYVGYLLAGAAGAVARRSLPAFGLTAAYGVLCAWWVPVEERALLREFGDDYRRFCDQSPRWLGRPGCRRR